MNFNKKGIELAVNTIVMLIIGIILFGLGMSLFSTFISAGDERIDDLSGQVRTGLGELQCRGGDWICTPTVSLNLGDRESSYVYIVNRDSQSKQLRFSFDSSSYEVDESSDIPSGITGFESENCGSILVGGYTEGIEVGAGESAALPFEILTTRVRDQGCSFTLLVKLHDETGDTGERTPLIINVE